MRVPTDRAGAAARGRRAGRSAPATVLTGIVLIWALATGLASAVPEIAVAASATPTPNASTNPLSGGPTIPAPTPSTSSSTPTVVATNGTATGGSSNLSKTSVIGIVIGVVIVLGGVVAYIFRDARSRTRSRRRVGASVDGDPRVPGSRRPPKARKLSSQERKRRKRGRAPRR